MVVLHARAVARDTDYRTHKSLHQTPRRSPEALQKNHDPQSLGSGMNAENYISAELLSTKLLREVTGVLEIRTKETPMRGDMRERRKICVSKTGISIVVSDLREIIQTDISGRDEDRSVEQGRGSAVHVPR